MGHLDAAVAALRAELDDVEQRFAALEQRRARLRAAIEAAQAVDATGRSMSTRPVLSGGVTPIGEVTARVHRDMQRAPSIPSEAAMIILKEAGRPLHIRDLIADIQARGWFTDKEYESLRGTVASYLDSRAREGHGVIKPGPATYQLAPRTHIEQRIIESARALEAPVHKFSGLWRQELAREEEAGDSARQRLKP